MPKKTFTPPKRKCSDNIWAFHAFPSVFVFLFLRGWVCVCCFLLLQLLMLQSPSLSLAVCILSLGSVDFLLLSQCINLPSEGKTKPYVTKQLWSLRTRTNVVCSCRSPFLSSSLSLLFPLFLFFFLLAIGAAEEDESRGTRADSAVESVFSLSCFRIFFFIAIYLILLWHGCDVNMANIDWRAWYGVQHDMVRAVRVRMYGCSGGSGFLMVV